MSEYILDCKPYHKDYVSINWQDCTLRKWLNNEFYNTAFNAAEKEQVVKKRNDGNGVGSANDKKCPATDDYVFLLNTAEVAANAAELGEQAQIYDFKRRAVITPWLLEQKKSGKSNIWVYGLRDNGTREESHTDADGYLSINGTGFLTFKGEGTNGCSYWWLRNRGSYGASYAARVRDYGSVLDTGNFVNYVVNGVRPCVRVRL